MMRLPLLLASVFAFIGASSHVAATSITERQSRTAPLLGAFPGQAPLPTLAQILGLNVTNGTYLPLENIQGDILVGMRKQKERFVFFHVNDASQFKKSLQAYIPARITSCATLISSPDQQPLAFVNLAFSSAGLTALGIEDDLYDARFTSGMFADAQNLGDDLSQWAAPFTGTTIHGVFLIGSDQNAFLDQYTSDITSFFGTSLTQVKVLSGSSRPGTNSGHEHFGYLDGISQPAITGWAIDVLPGQAVVPTGVILTGRFGDPIPRPVWAIDGTFMAFRHLQQKVPEFHAYTIANAIRASPAGLLTPQQGAELLGARMFGRWKSGAPLDLAPTRDDPALGADHMRNNNFAYVDGVLDQTECPFGAHVRKTNPRADFPGLEVINHAIRASIPYGPETSSAELASGIPAGCLGQQSTPIAAGIDPIIGQGTPRSMGGLDPLYQSKTYTLPQFVIPKGGEYFFMPSISALMTHIAR